MPSYTAGDRARTPESPMPLAAPHAREPTAIPAAEAAASRGPPRTAEPTTRTSSGPGVSDRTAASTTNPQRPSMPRRRRGRPAGSGPEGDRRGARVRRAPRCPDAGGGGERSAGSGGGGRGPADRRRLGDGDVRPADAELGERVLEALVQQHEPIDQPPDVLQRGRDGERSLHEEPEEAVEVAALVVLAHLRLARLVADPAEERPGDPAVQGDRRPGVGADRVVDLVGGHPRGGGPAVGRRRRADDQPDR